MICKNCGSELMEDMVFCGKCGAKVEAEEVAETVEAVENEEVVETVETVEAEEVATPETSGSENATEPMSEIVENNEEAQVEEIVKKKSKWKMWTAIGVTVAIVAGIVAFAFPYVSNAFWQVILSDEEYFEHVIKSNVSDCVESVSDAYADMIDMYAKAESMHYDGKLEIGEKAKSLIYDYSYGSADIGWLNSFSYSGESGFDDGKIYGAASYSINDKHIIDVNTIIDGEATYMDFPGISDGGLRTEMYGDNADVIKALIAFYEVAPDEKVMSELVVRYMAYIAESVEDVEKTSDTVEAGGVSKTYTKYTAKIDEEVVEDAIETVLTEAKTDKDIEKLIIEFCDSEDAEDVYKAYQDGIDELLEELDMDDASFVFDFVIWVDAKGNITGMGVDFEGGEVYAVNALDGKTSGTKFRVNAPDFNLTFEGGSTLKSGKVNGEYALNVMGMDVVDVVLTDIDYSLAKKDVLNGKIEISVAKGAKAALELTEDDTASLIANAKIVLDSKATDVYNNAFEIAAYSDNDMLLKLSIDTEPTKANVPVIDKYIDSDDFREYEEWYRTVGENILSKLSEVGLDLGYIG